NLDTKLFDSSIAKQATLDRLVRERLLQVAAQKMHLGVSDQRLANELQQNPNIAGLRRPDGSLDLERYRQLLATQGLTPESFEAQVRSDLSTRQVMAGLGITSFATPVLADVTLNAFYEKRQIQVAKFTAADFTAQIKPTDADLEDYYKANGEKFKSAERADVDFVILDLAAIQKTVTVPEAELKNFYEQNLARLANLEERRASHILINADKAAPAAERDKARAKAQEILATLKQSPDKFGELAKKFSQDTGSANKGGDLDFFARGAMVKPFEEAAFSLKKGETSDVVESEFGFHIIRVTDIKQPKQKSFEESRASLEVDARRQLAQRKFAEAADQFTNLVYEQSDSLKPAADKLKLEIQHAKGVGTEPVPAASGTAMNNPKFLAAIFSSDTIEKKRNTEAIELAPNVLASARITNYQPARILPFADVKDKVREQVVAQKALERAKQEGESNLAQWKASPDKAKLAASVVVSREQKQQLSDAVIEAALRANSQTLPAWVGVDLGGSGYAVVKVEKILPRETVDASQQSRERQQYMQWWAGAEEASYYRWLKDKFKVEIKASRL
ncbi:MAG: peptidyl-prolyl cis-trans isomerase, partial [Betaproteobacteria bacterium]|nr:peptidyl-prolyl cis-trans isomerase [Betaproteobacteria bacterium]